MKWNWKPKSNFLRKFKSPFTPRGWLRSARNFGKMRFRRFAIFHFRRRNFFFQILLAKLFGANFCFKKVRFWRSYEFLIRVGRCVVKSYCPKWPYFWGDVLGEGVNDSKRVETLDLAPKMTSTIWCCDRIFAGQFLFSRNWRFGGAGQVWASLACRSQKVIACSSFIFGETSLEKG